MLEVVHLEQEEEELQEQVEGEPLVEEYQEVVFQGEERQEGEQQGWEVVVVHQEEVHLEVARSVVEQEVAHQEVEHQELEEVGEVALVVLVPQEELVALAFHLVVVACFLAKVVEVASHLSVVEVEAF